MSSHSERLRKSCSSTLRSGIPKRTTYENIRESDCCAIQGCRTCRRDVMFPNPNTSRRRNGSHSFLWIDAKKIIRVDSVRSFSSFIYHHHLIQHFHQHTWHSVEVICTGFRSLGFGFASAFGFSAGLDSRSEQVGRACDWTCPEVHVRIRDPSILRKSREHSPSQAVYVRGTPYA